jgi:hypothetical protein
VETPWFSARYMSGSIEIRWREGGLQTRIWTGVEPESIDIEGYELTVRLPTGKTLLVDGRDGETLEISPDVGT